jgi:hypothetical protein
MFQLPESNVLTTRKNKVSNCVQVLHHEFVWESKDKAAKVLVSAQRRGEYSASCYTYFMPAKHTFLV